MLPSQDYLAIQQDITSFFLMYGDQTEKCYVLRDIPKESPFREKLW